jgi:hypothetical protein
MLPTLLKPVPLKNAVERLTARVAGPREGLRRVLKASQTPEQRLFCGRSYYQDGRRAAVLSSVVKRQFRSVADWFQRVLRSGCHSIQRPGSPYDRFGFVFLHGSAQSLANGPGSQTELAAMAFWSDNNSV